eukprot:gnl/TRDRNA2_/TRDRNA2_37845_c0_seq2.p1 gnl/TRDRNA2_/TRDRNA2_37845_c0~~gnl/TRDRNA2_/TRDRNA2_37845_c0_seq2.p1  ORF type:complete len:412 (-),score=90.68 gnl/TRDRNA2_/TRDRNA2_37845_c0_seq2:404-1639(-)
MKLSGAMFRSHSIFVLSLLALAADASLGNVTVHQTAVKPPAAKDQKAEIEALRMQLEKVSFALTVTSHHPGGSLAESKTTDAALALAEQLKTLLKETTGSSDAKALKRLQDAQEAVQSFTKDLTVEQSSFLKKEGDEQVQSLLLDTLWRVDNQPFAQQLQVLQSDVFQNLAVVQAVLAQKDMTTPLLKQVYRFLDKHTSTSPASKDAAKTKRDNVSVLKMQAMAAGRRFANSTSQLDKSSTQQLVNSELTPLEFSRQMKNRPLIMLGPLALSNGRLDNSSSRQSLGQLKAKVNSTTRELDNSSIRELGNSTTRELDNSSTRLSFDQLKATVKSTIRRLNNSSAQLFLGQLGQLKVDRGFLSMLQMPAIPARQRLGNSSTRLSLDKLKATVNSKTRRLDNLSTRLSQAMDHA